ncbi:MAG: DIP1984 family protein [Deltaproteobacteria bacterium]|jgi:vacuolar-type H+-ATPase subunit E/Vma4|nr:DIP1984 family protein [Deltaproteobacteria bacterium]
MKLAEALILRSDLQHRTEQLKQRILRNAKVQEGDSPAEDPNDLLKEFESMSKELTKLIQSINQTNSNTEIEKGVTLSDGLAQRDVLKIKHNIYSELAKAATVTHDRYSKSEVRFISTIKVAEIQKTADKLAKEHRGLDSMIQEVNWKTELIL